MRVDMRISGDRSVLFHLDFGTCASGVAGDVPKYDLESLLDIAMVEQVGIGMKSTMSMTRGAASAGSTSRLRMQL